eukprot:TRINITY_DN41003_c0_g1_i1.p2 TRINITY_DN41003_c0_g1~~TRINITY_DN41003_c0_g1_i1.p2  ORF type:complete len:319 (-),score=57.58 TRINITY_DN41003_c0_g1_i1:1410-2324(-)
MSETAKADQGVGQDAGNVPGASPSTLRVSDGIAQTLEDRMTEQLTLVESRLRAQAEEEQQAVAGALETDFQERLASELATLEQDFQSRLNEELEALDKSVEGRIESAIRSMYGGAEDISPRALRQAIDELRTEVLEGISKARMSTSDDVERRLEQHAESMETDFEERLTAVMTALRESMESEQQPAMEEVESKIDALESRLTDLGAQHQEHANAEIALLETRLRDLLLSQDDSIATELEDVRNRLDEVENSAAGEALAAANYIGEQTSHLQVRISACEDGLDELHDSTVIVTRLVDSALVKSTM